MIQKIKPWVGPFVGAIILISALTILKDELQHYHYRDIIKTLGNIPFKSILLALLFTFANYIILILYELEGFQYIKNPLPRSKVALTSFIAFAFSNNVGFYSISGSAVRFRLYSAWGLSTQEITKLISYSSVIAFWLGLSTICGFVFLFAPLKIPEYLHIPAGSTHILGALFISVVFVFLAFSAIRKEPVKVFNWEFDIPPIWLTLLLIITAALDWIFFAAVLYVLLPFGNAISFPLFVGYFLVAQLAGLISHVPGGLGVFETVLLLVLPKGIPAPVALGSLVVFRFIYYFLPLGIAAILLGVHEFYEKRHAIHGVAKKVTEWSTSIIPNIFAAVIFAGGVILLFSGATPEEKVRLDWLIELMPLTILEVSHFLGSVAGVILLILSYGVYRRLDSAYYLSLYMLASGVVFSLLKGLDYEEAIILTVILLALLPCKDHFYRKSSLVNDQFSIKWMIAVLAAIACTIWLGFFSYKHVYYANELWWQFSFNANSSRFLRATAGSVVVTLIFALLRLFVAPRHRFEPSGKETIDRVKAILSASDFSYAQLALLGDKNFMFDESGSAFIMYGVQGASWIAMGDPVGPQSITPQLLWQYREMVDAHSGRTVFYEVRKENLHLYIDLGLTLMKMGEAARVDLSQFTIEGSQKKNLRYIKRHIEKDGWRFEIIEKDDVPAILPELKKISEDWLTEKNTREKKFTLGNFNETYLSEFPMAIVRNDSKIVAFSNLWITGTKKELSIDLMRYSKDAPKSVMEYLFTNLLLWGNSQGFDWFDMGMAPFSGMETRALAPMWSKLGGLLFSYGENFYNFQGLRQFKEKFDPVWEPRYLACPGGLSLPLVLRDAATLASGGLKGVVSK
jgi:phosphatidylglycerol lysyltransferase